MPAAVGNQFLRDLVVTEGEITVVFQSHLRAGGAWGKHQGLQSLKQKDTEQRNARWFEERKTPSLNSNNTEGNWKWLL